VPLCGVAPLLGFARPGLRGLGPSGPGRPLGVAGGQGPPRQGLPAGASEPEPVNLIIGINSDEKREGKSEVISCDIGIRLYGRGTLWSYSSMRGLL